jgi:hypothetical protein
MMPRCWTLAPAIGSGSRFGSRRHGNDVNLDLLVPERGDRVDTCGSTRGKEGGRA